MSKHTSSWDVLTAAWSRGRRQAQRCLGWNQGSDQTFEDVGSWCQELCAALSIHRLPFSFGSSSFRNPRESERQEIVHWVAEHTRILLERWSEDMGCLPTWGRQAILDTYPRYDQWPSHDKYEAGFLDPRASRLHVQSTEAVETPLRYFLCNALCRRACQEYNVTPVEQVDCQFEVFDIPCTGQVVTLDVCCRFGQ